MGFQDERDRKAAAYDNTKAMLEQKINELHKTKDDLSLMTANYHKFYDGYVELSTRNKELSREKLELQSKIQILKQSVANGEELFNAMKHELEEAIRRLQKYHGEV